MKKILGLVIVGASAVAMASTVIACNKFSHETTAIKLLNAQFGQGSKERCAVWEDESNRAYCEKSYDDLKAAWTSFSLTVEKSQTNVNTVEGIEYTIATIQYTMIGNATVGDVYFEVERTSILHFMFNANNKVVNDEVTYTRSVKPAEITTGTEDSFDKYKKAA